MKNGKVYLRKIYLGKTDRVVLGLLAMLFIGLGLAVAAYLLGTTEVSVNVAEAIGLSPSTVSVDLYPNEEAVVTVTLTNAGSVDIEVDFTVDVTGPSTDLQVTTDPNNKVNVPATGSATVDITITAKKSIVPGSYTVTVTWER